jgi:hypothetical protein
VTEGGCKRVTSDVDQWDPPLELERWPMRGSMPVSPPAWSSVNDAQDGRTHMSAPRFLLGWVMCRFGGGMGR